LSIPAGSDEAGLAEAGERLQAALATLTAEVRERAGEKP
jgi:hypothetical protein